MTLSSATWQHAWYESLGVLAFCLYPFFVFRLFRRAEIWRTSAPALLMFVPLFHSIALAYLAIRSVFVGMALTQIDRPRIAIAAGLADVHGLLEIGACFSILVLVIALFAARRNRPLPGIAKGRTTAIVAITASLLLTAGVFAITYLLVSAPARRWQLLALIHPGAIASGVLVVFTIGAAALLIWRSARGDLPANGSHWPALGVCFAILAVIGAAAWLVQNWLRHIARTGF